VHDPDADEELVRQAGIYNARNSIETLDNGQMNRWRNVVDDLKDREKYKKSLRIVEGMEETRAEKEIKALADEDLMAWFLEEEV
jgi:hypothetical protein